MPPDLALLLAFFSIKTECRLTRGSETQVVTAGCDESKRPPCGRTDGPKSFTSPFYDHCRDNTFQPQWILIGSRDRRFQCGNALTENKILTDVLQEPADITDSKLRKSLRSLLSLLRLQLHPDVSTTVQRRKEAAEPLTGTDDDEVMLNVPMCRLTYYCLLYTSPSPRDRHRSRMPSSA